MYETSTNIITLSESDYYQLHIFDFFEVDLKYVILGMLSEYFGGYRFPNDSQTIDFSFNTRKIDFLLHICNKCLTLSDTNSDVLIDTNNKGLLIKSKKINQIIREIYSFSASDWLGDDLYFFQKNHEIYEYIPVRLLKNNTQILSKKISFLYGVMLSNSNLQNGTINFSNAGHKADLTIKLLKDFEAFGGSFKVEYYFNVPCITRITIDDKNILWQNYENFKNSV